MTSESLLTLHTALIDARQGYKTAIEKAETPHLADLLRSVDRLHASAHADVDRILSAQGERPDEDGSMMGTVHEAVVTVRSAVIGLDEGSLSSFASGEENNVEAYDDAIADAPSEDVRQVLVGHRDALAAKIQDMKRQAA